jgi:hypothetical protein
VVYPADRPLSIEENWARIREVPKGEFMTMIGHDDILFPHYLEEMSDLIARHPDASLYQAHYTYIDPEGKFLRYCQPMDERQGVGEFLACQMARTIESTGTGYLMRSADFDRLGGMPTEYPNLIFSDYTLWISLMQLGYKATSARTCFSYRLHESLSKRTDGQLYVDAFRIYLDFLGEVMERDPSIALTMERYGREFLLYYCESLSHRLLKTLPGKRHLSVKQWVSMCEQYASRLIPGQSFSPRERSRTKYAIWIDSNPISRGLFRSYRKL